MQRLSIASRLVENAFYIPWHRRLVAPWITLSAVELCLNAGETGLRFFLFRRTKRKCAKNKSSTAVGDPENLV